MANPPKLFFTCREGGGRMKIALIINTFNRLEDARIQMKLVRDFWPQEKLLRAVTIYHLYNGKKSWYPQKYLEDFLIRTRNPGHYQGAALLIDLGIKVALEAKVKFDYLMVTSADVWLIKPAVLAQLLRQMTAERFLLASSRWFFQKALATEFFIIQPQFAKKIFPLNLPLFEKVHPFLSLFSRSFINLPIVEICFARKVVESLNCSFNDNRFKKQVMFLPGRENVHWLNHYFSPSLGYFSHHNLEEKKRLVSQMMPAIAKFVR